ELPNKALQVLIGAIVANGLTQLVQGAIPALCNVKAVMNELVHEGQNLRKDFRSDLDGLLKLLRIKSVNRIFRDGAPNRRTKSLKFLLALLVLPQPRSMNSR